MEAPGTTDATQPATEVSDGAESEERVLLPDSALARLRSDAATCTALRDPGLQRMIRGIDTASDRAGALAAAKRGPAGYAFSSFVDSLLLAVGAAHSEAGQIIFDG